MYLSPLAFFSAGRSVAAPVGLRSSRWRCLRGCLAPPAPVKQPHRPRPLATPISHPGTAALPPTGDHRNLAAAHSTRTRHSIQTAPSLCGCASRTVTRRHRVHRRGASQSSCGFQVRRTVLPSCGVQRGTLVTSVGNLRRLARRQKWPAVGSAAVQLVLGRQMGWVCPLSQRTVVPNRFGFCARGFIDMANASRWRMGVGDFQGVLLKWVCSGFASNI